MRWFIDIGGENGILTHDSLAAAAFFNCESSLFSAACANNSRWQYQLTPLLSAATKTGLNG